MKDLPTEQEIIETSESIRQQIADHEKVISLTESLQRDNASAIFYSNGTASDEVFFEQDQRFREKIQASKDQVALLTERLKDTEFGINTLKSGDSI